MSIIANNRFLQPVNKQIVRGLADAGANFVGNGHVLHPLYRQMVDLGISGNLKLWVHRDLVKTRTSGSDLFVPAAYDLSSNNNDAVQATTGNQPKLVSTGMEFDGKYLNLGNATDLNFGEGSMSICAWIWVNSDTSTTTLGRIFHNGAQGDSTSQAGFCLVNHRTVIGFLVNPTGTRVIKYISLPSTETWTFACGVLNRAANLQIWVNSSVGEISAPSSGSISNSNDKLIGVVNTSLGNPFEGISNDIRVFNKALSSTEISAIYNTTKSFYGL